MLTRTLVFSSPAFLSLKLNSLVAEFSTECSKPPVSAPIEDLGLIVLDEPRITITTALLAALQDAGVAIITTDKKHMPCGLMLPFNAHSLQSKIYQKQAEFSPVIKKRLWKQIVQAKIDNQIALLKNTGREFTLLKKIRKEVKSNDTTNCEGQAAVFYWKNLIPNIENFTRDPDGTPPNNLLNYGYAILRAIVARSIVCAGLHPTPGIFHRNQYNAYCLADDLMEAYRPFVDKIVLDILRSNDDITSLSKKMKGTLFSIGFNDVEIGGITRPLMLATAQTATSYAKIILGEASSLSLPKLPPNGQG